MRKIISALDVTLRRYTPEPFVLALVLTLITFLCAVFLTPSTPTEVLASWGDNIWSLKEFTLQMAMVLTCGYAVACSRPVELAVDKLCRPIRTESGAVVLVTVVSVLTFSLNWGLGMVTTAFLCRKLGARLKRVNYPLLVAAGYGGFVVWHGGLSGSIPLLLATPGNFTESAIGRVISIQETLLAPYNLFLIAAVFVTMPLLGLFLSRAGQGRQLSMPSEETKAPEKAGKTPADKIERSRLLAWTLVAMALFFLVNALTARGKRFTLDHVNFIFLFLGLALHGNPRQFMTAIYDGAKNAGPILLQFPFYGGIMGILSGTGLGGLISTRFAEMATVGTYPLMTFLSAAFVNLFVPSGGGQWAVQGPIVIQSAKVLGADVTKAAMAVAWGGTWTDLLQPFWAVPLLSIAGLHLREVIGYLLIIFLVLGVLLVGTFAVI